MCGQCTCELESSKEPYPRMSVRTIQEFILSAFFHFHVHTDVNPGGQMLKGPPTSNPRSMRIRSSDQENCSFLVAITVLSPCSLGCLFFYLFPKPEHIIHWSSCTVGFEVKWQLTNLLFLKNIHQTPHVHSIVLGVRNRNVGSNFCLGNAYHSAAISFSFLL